MRELLVSSVAFLCQICAHTFYTSVHLSFTKSQEAEAVSSTVKLKKLRLSDMKQVYKVAQSANGEEGYKGRSDFSLHGP